MSTSAVLATETKPMAVDQIVDALDRHYSKQGSVYGRRIATFTELRVGTGYGKSNEQRIDYFAINLWPSSGLGRTALEIKVSRSDFLAELKKPIKRRCALLVSNQFYFASPKGLIKPEELPLEAGLCEVTETGNIEWTVSAPWRDTIPPPWSFFASVARTAQFFRDECKSLRKQLDAQRPHMEKLL